MCVKSEGMERCIPEEQKTVRVSINSIVPRVSATDYGWFASYFLLPNPSVAHCLAVLPHGSTYYTW